MNELEYRLKNIEKNFKSVKVNDEYCSWVIKKVLFDIKQFNKTKSPKKKLAFINNIKSNMIGLIYFTLNTKKYKINEFIMDNYKFVFEHNLYLKIN